METTSAIPAIPAIAQSVAQVHSYFRSGATKNLATRTAALQALRESIVIHSDDLYKALHKDLHKSPSESFLTEVSIVLHEIDDHLRHIKSWARPRKVPTPLTIMPARSRIMPEPLGTVLIIAPWNYPFQLLIMPLIGAISAGNTAVLKPSEYVPNVNSVIRTIIAESFRPDYVAFVEGGHEANQLLLSERFDHIFFTGSPLFGGAVMTAAAKNMTPVTLELGGKSPCIVDAKAKIDIAARRIVWGKLLNAGQTCIAPDYLFVHKDLYDRLLTQIIHYIKASFGNNPQQSEEYPRIINDRAFERLMQAMHSSGNIVYGGQSDRTKLYIAPTIIEAPLDDSQLMMEEIFGPILPIKVFEDIDQVIHFVNQRPKPLALYYFGDTHTAKKVIRETSSGGTCINDTITHIANHNLPFGGVGNSGMGRYHSRASFDLLSNQRSIVWSATWIDIPFRYAPYLSIKWLKRLMS